MKISVIMLAFTSFGAAQALGGSGFIAAFCGGLLFGALLKDEREKFLVAGEGIGDCFAMITWIFFGLVVASRSALHLSWQVLLYAVLSLTVIRMLPVFLAMHGLKATTEDKLFVGWFGPRGLASVVFIIMVLEADLPHGDTIASAAVATIVLSILLHGITASPWAKAYGRRHRESTTD